MNILEEHDLNSFVTTVIEDPTTNAGRINYKRNQEKEKRIIYDSMKDNLMSVITPLKMTKECFDTLTNLLAPKNLFELRTWLSKEVVVGKQLEGIGSNSSVL